MLPLWELFNQNFQNPNDVSPILFFKIKKGKQAPVLLGNRGVSLLGDLHPKFHLLDRFVVVLHLVINSRKEKAWCR